MSVGIPAASRAAPAAAYAHAGVRLGGDVVTPVLAAASGTVRWMHDERGGRCCDMEVEHEDGSRDVPAGGADRPDEHLSRDDRAGAEERDAAEAEAEAPMLEPSRVDVGQERIRSEEEWTLQLLEREVLVQPGYFYDFPNEAFLVASLLAPERDFREGITRLCGCLE